MADRSRGADELATKLIDVKVLSQLAHPHGTIHFHRIRAGTSVHELRTRVGDVISISPAPESLRFIYQGRALTRESDTLIDVFGGQAVEQVETHIIHLVVREQPRLSSMSLSSSNGVARPTQTTSSHSISHQSSSRAVPSPPIPLQEHYQGVPQGTPHLNQSQNTGYAPHTQLPGVIPQTPFGRSMNIDAPPVFAAQSQQQRTNPLVNPMQQTTDFQGLVQRQIAHQRQSAQAFTVSQPAVGADATPSPRGLDPQDTLVQTDPSSDEQTSGQLSSTLAGRTVRGDNNDRESPETSLGNSNFTSSLGTAAPELTSRRGFGANGSTWTFTTSSSTHHPLQIGLPHSMQPHMASQGSNFPQRTFSHYDQVNMIPFAPYRTYQTGYELNRGPSAYSGWLGPVHAVDYMENVLGQLEEALQLFRTAPVASSSPERAALIRNRTACLRAYIAHRNRAQQIINDVLAYGTPGGHTAPTAEHVATLQSLYQRFQSVARAFLSELHDDSSLATTSRVGSETLGPESRLTRGEPAVNGSNAQIRNTSPRMSNSSSQEEQSKPQSNVDKVTVYMLRSPQGPRAILYSRDGVFSNESNSHQHGISQRFQADVEQYLRAPNIDATAGPQLTPNQGPGNPQVEHLAQQLQGIPQQDGANAIAINLTPFFQALWLFIRGYAFMWLFLGTRGSGEGFLSWRSILLLGLSFAYWAIQAGVGAEQIGLVRRRWDELIGVNPEAREVQDGQEGRDAPLPDAVPVENPETENQTDHHNPRQPQPYPQRQASATQDRPERRRRPQRDWLRSLQRTSALFLASLYPGIGERHVAEQDRVRRATQEVERVREAATAAQEDSTQDSTGDHSSKNSEESGEPGSSATQSEKSPSASRTSTTLVEGTQSPAAGQRDQ